MSKRPISVCSFGSSSCGSSPQRRISSASSSVSPSGDESAGGFGICREQRVALRLGLGELLLGALQLLLHAAQLLELLGRRLSLQLRLRPQLVDARDERAPALVGGEPGVERLGGALAREPAPELVRVGAGGARVDHERESTNASNS